MSCGGFLWNKKFYDEIKNILITARNKVYQTANFAMVEAYWNIGKSIIEEQGGNEKAEYGQFIERIIETNDSRFWKRIYCCQFEKYEAVYLTFPMATHCVAN